jgi:hypothetical protein
MSPDVVGLISAGLTGAVTTAWARKRAAPLDAVLRGSTVFARFECVVRCAPRVARVTLPPVNDNHADTFLAVDKLSTG